MRRNENQRGKSKFHPQESRPYSFSLFTANVEYFIRSCEPPHGSHKGKKIVVAGTLSAAS